MASQSFPFGHSISKLLHESNELSKSFKCLVSDLIVRNDDVNTIQWSNNLIIRRFMKVDNVFQAYEIHHDVDKTDWFPVEYYHINWVDESLKNSPLIVLNTERNSALLLIEQDKHVTYSSTYYVKIKKSVPLSSLNTISKEELDYSIEKVEEPAKSLGYEVKSILPWEPPRHKYMMEQGMDITLYDPRSIWLLKNYSTKIRDVRSMIYTASPLLGGPGIIYGVGRGGDRELAYWDMKDKYVKNKLIRKPKGMNIMFHDEAGNAIIKEPYSAYCRLEDLRTDVLHFETCDSYPQINYPQGSIELQGSGFGYMDSRPGIGEYITIHDVDVVPQNVNNKFVFWDINKVLYDNGASKNNIIAYNIKTDERHMFASEPNVTSMLIVNMSILVITTTHNKESLTSGGKIHLYDLLHDFKLAESSSRIVKRSILLPNDRYITINMDNTISVWNKPDPLNMKAPLPSQSLWDTITSYVSSSDLPKVSKLKTYGLPHSVNDLLYLGGTLIALGMDNGQITIMDYIDGRTIETIQAHKGPVTALVRTGPKMFASSSSKPDFTEAGGFYGTIKIWQRTSIQN